MLQTFGFLTLFWRLLSKEDFFEIFHTFRTTLETFWRFCFFRDILDF